MDLNAYLHMDACTLAAHIKKGKVSPEEALSFAIERCEQVNPHLNAIRHRFEEWGRQQLKKMGGSERFYGVPLLVKELEPILWRFYQDGLTLSAHQLILAKDRLFQLLAPLRNLLSDGSVILSPALAKDPVNLGELSMADEYETYLEKNLAFSPFTALCNQAGIPAISLPVQSKYPLPLAVQLIMGKWRDAQLLDLCKTLKKIGLWQEYPVVSPLLD